MGVSVIHHGKLAWQISRLSRLNGLAQTVPFVRLFFSPFPRAMLCYFYTSLMVGHCPSGDDPQTTTVETNCTGVGTNLNYTGDAGNLCHVDCSNRGICDYSSGICQCFNNFYGAACEMTSALAEESVVVNYGDNPYS
jgi:hypothetical protein